MDLEEGEWKEALSSFHVSEAYGTCKTEHSSSGGSSNGDSRFITLYKDQPMTFVVVGEGEGNLDIKFKDSTYVFEHKFQVDAQNYLIIPPYQPVEWIIIRLNQKYDLCSYSDSVYSEDSNAVSSNCACTNVVNNETSSFSSVTFPRTIRKPEQPFFLTADITPAADDVTICTILTVDRLLRLSQMSEMWGGPISAAVFLHDLSEVSHVMSWYLANSSLRRYVDIHLVYDDKIIAFELPDRAFPVNILRNVAIRFARTANVFYIEGDFIPSPDLYPSLGEVKTRLAKGEKSVFIVAPFSSDKADFDMNLFPQDKYALIDMLNSTEPLLRDLSYFNSHAAFKFDDWKRATEIYSMGFSGGYEPYYIGPKSYPLFEEIFIGCGADKVSQNKASEPSDRVSHPIELNSAGYKFKVLPTGFIVHIDSTGMGSAWCRGWSGNARSMMKWDAFTTKTSHIYSHKGKGSFDSRVPWWDLAPVGRTVNEAAEEDDVCTGPPPPDEKECPECICKECEKCEECPKCPATPGCPPSSKSDCERFTEGYAADLTRVRASLRQSEDQTAKLEKELATLHKDFATLRLENERLAENSKFVVNLSIGVLVVLAVVMGLGVCIWPRNRSKVWVLPTWKSTHHNL